MKILRLPHDKTDIIGIISYITLLSFIIQYYHFSAKIFGTTTVLSVRGFELFPSFLFLKSVSYYK